ncbi:MAG: Cna B-type domain-containing protein, partial [Clostridia bacterium]|nr:Cna B-type domain-containing protein [Clostridia bacterium]
MKYMMKKTIAFLLTLVMLVNILPVSVLAEQPEEGRRGPLNAPATRSAQGHSVSVNFGRDVYISDEDNVYVLVRQVQTVAFSENDVRQIMCYQIEKVSNSSSFPMVFNNLKVAYNDNLYVTYELNNNTTQVLLCSAPDLQEYRFVGDELQGVTDYSTSYNSNTVQISLTDDKGSSTINIGEVLPNTYTVELKFYQYNSNEPESVSTLGEGTYTIEATDTEGHVYHAEITGSNSIQFYDESDTLVSSLPEITSWAFKKDGDVTDTLGDYEITSITPTVKNGASNTEKVYVFEARVPKHYTVTLDYQDSQGNTPESVTLNDTYTLAVTTTKDVELTAYINTDGTLSSAWSDGKNYILKAKSFQLQDSEGNLVDGKLGNYLVTYPTNMDPDNGIYHISLHEPKTCTASVNVQATLTDNYDYYIVAKKNGRAYAYAQFITTAANLQFTAITRDTPVLDEETTFEVIRVTKDTSVSDGTAFENAAEEDKVTASGGQIDGNKITWNLTTSEDGTSDFAFTVEPNLPEGVFRRVHVNLYNEDGETISDTYETDLAGHKYFVRLYLYEKNEDGTNGQLIGYQNQNSWILPSQIQGIDVDFTNTQFQNVAGSAESLYDGQGTTQYDPEQHNIQVRLLQADQYADSQSITNNSFTSVIEGYMFKAAPYGNVTAGGVTTLNLKKAYPASYHVVIQKGEGVDLNRLHNEGLRLYAEANHQNNHKDYYIENLNNLGMNGPAAAELTLTICDNDENKNWTYSQDDFSGNETTKARLVKNFNNANLTYTETPDGALIKIGQDVFIVTYPEKTIIDDKETDPANPKTVYTDYIKIEKIEVSNDYSYTSILGSGVYYGITAQYFDQGGHIQSNFAANKYYPGNIVEPDLAGNGSVIVIADPQPAPDGYYLEIGGSHVDGTDTVVYMGNNGTSDNVRNSSDRPWVHVVPSETDYLNESIVQPIINHGISISNELLQHGVSFDQKTCNIDLLDLPEDATIYLDGDALKDWISKSKDDGLHITKHPNQTIVFNFDTSTDVTLGQYHIRYSRDDDYQVSHSPTGKGDSVNAFMDNLAQHMVFNCNSAKNVTINTCVGMVLVPSSDSYTLINGTSAGWIISNGTVHNDGAEWHSVYSQLPSATKTNLTVGKTVDGNTPAKNQKFTFTLYHLDTSNEWQQVPSPENASNNYNPTQNANGAVSFNNVALADEDAGWNVYKITESGKAQGTPGEYVQNTQTVYAFVNYITVGSTKIATPPIYYITASEDDNEEDTILFKESNFNKLATTLEGAIGSPTGDNVIRLKKMPKPVFENEQKKDGLYFKKRVKGAGNDNDTFTFRVTLKSLVVNESTNTVVYKLKKTGNVNFTNITFTRIEGTNDFSAEVTLKRNQSANIDKIPHNTQYIIEEIKVNNKPITANEAVDGYTIDSNSIAQGGTVEPGHNEPLEFINMKTGETELTGTKTWVDGNKTHNNANEITLTLKRKSAKEGASEETLTTLPEGATFGWTGNTYKYQHLPLYDDDGYAYTYSVTETAITGYTTTQNGNNFTNTITGETELTGTKTWKDGGKTHNNANEITLTLKRKSAKNGSTEETVTNATPVWNGNTYKYDKLPKYDAEGYEYTYSVTETAIAGYTTTQNGNNFINTKTGKVQFDVKKNWKGGTDTEHITITAVLKNGDTVVDEVDLTAAGNWTGKFKELDQYDADGQEIDYSGY